MRGNLSVTLAVRAQFLGRQSSLTACSEYHIAYAQLPFNAIAVAIQQSHVEILHLLLHRDSSTSQENDTLGLGDV